MLTKIIHQGRINLPQMDLNTEGDVILLDKPERCTSFDLVAKIKTYIRKNYKQKIKVGHAGTLDPMASGLMIVCIGKFTKKIESFQAQEKEYTGTFCVGATTPSFDLEKPIDETFPFEHITREMAIEKAKEFLGDIEQVPPQYSAVWINGRRAFDYARENEEVEIKPKNINISIFEITRFELPYIDFRIVCSKGTYIRSVARDFGYALGSGAHLTALRRTRIGNFHVDNAIKMVKENQSID